MPDSYVDLYLLRLVAEMVMCLRSLNTASGEPEIFYIFVFFKVSAIFCGALVMH